jgi:primase-polymerase (primpol)-like protein
MSKIIPCAGENGQPRSKSGIEHAKDRPKSLPVDFDGIPTELTERAQWVNWRWQRRQNKKGIRKWTKPPINSLNGELASSTDPATWGTHEQARAFYLKHPEFVDGVGYVLTPPHCGIDLDDSVDLETGTLKEWAEPIVRDLSSYTEISPSRTGVKILTKAILVKTRNQTGHIELYSAGRYFALTGCRFGHSPSTIEERQDAIACLQQQLTPRKQQPSGRSTAAPISLSDQEIIDRAKAAKNGLKFTQLWEGSTSGYTSASEADLALLGMLAFWTGGDAARMDGLFRQSGLFREKWEQRGDYRYRTIALALEARSEYYQPSRPPGKFFRPGIVRRKGVAYVSFSVEV